MGWETLSRTQFGKLFGKRRSSQIFLNKAAWMAINKISDKLDIPWSISVSVVIFGVVAARFGLLGLRKLSFPF